RNQQQQDGQLLRLPMSRRPPKFTKKSNIGARNRRAGSLARLRASKTHHTSTHTSSAKSTPTPIAANTSSFFQDAAYGIDLWIGNYPQRVTLDFDTGSSETWVSPPCTGWEDYPEYEDLCRLLGTYIPEQSSSMINNAETCDPSWIMYGSGDVYIAYYQDDIQFSDPYHAAEQFEPELGAVAQQVRFGLAIDAENMPSGIFGASYGAGYNQDYNSVIDDMHEQGVIATKDFSVALGSVGGENGEVIFGGIDVAKFTGELHEIEISHQLPKMMDGYYRYWINVTAIGFTKPGSCETVPVTPKGFDERFLPDTGTSLTYMPTEAFNKILDAFPDAQLSDEGFGYTVDCSHRTADGTIDYTFPDGFTVRVPFSEFIFLVPGDVTTNFQDTCIIGAVPTESLFILGDTFLRAVYAVFSQEHHKVYLAQYQDCGTHVVPSKGEKNKGMKGICSEAGEGVDPFYTSSTTYNDERQASSSWAWESSVETSIRMTFWSSTPISTPSPESSFMLSWSSFDPESSSSSSSDDWSSWSSTSSIPSSSSLSSELSWSWSWSASPTSSSSWDWRSSTSSSAESSTSSWDWGDSSSSIESSSTTTT
ncbi:Aspartic peptidase domain containing protein, partial [Rhypophila decipiens]